jgi:hypothetical protein
LSRGATERSSVFAAATPAELDAIEDAAVGLGLRLAADPRGSGPPCWPSGAPASGRMS